MDNQPNFFLLGAAKSGSTTLYNLLSQHSDIFLTKEKEPHFFDEDKFYNLGYDNYVQFHFKNAHKYPIRGESTPGYFHRHHIVITRMKKHIKDENLKFLIILRNPIQRAWSHYLHMVRNTFENETFEKGLELEEYRLEHDTKSWWWGYKTDSMYAKQLNAWFKNYSRDQFKIILNEDLKDNPKDTLKSIFNFLNVDPNQPIDFIKASNVASKPKYKLVAKYMNHPSAAKKLFKTIVPPWYSKKLRETIVRKNLIPLKKDEKPTIPQKDASNLLDQLIPDITELENLIGRDLSKWKKI